MTSPHVSAALAKFLARRSRAQLETLAELAIAMLDQMDGDTDREEDDHSGQYDEDYYTGIPPHFSGPGCVIGDPDMGAEEDGEPDTGGGCGEYGIDQTRLISRAAAFTNLNVMNDADVAMAVMHDLSMRHRLRGRLSPRFTRMEARP